MAFRKMSEYREDACCCIRTSDSDVTICKGADRRTIEESLRRAESRQASTSSSRLESNSFETPFTSFLFFGCGSVETATVVSKTFNAALTVSSTTPTTCEGVRYLEIELESSSVYVRSLRLLLDKLAWNEKEDAFWDEGGLIWVRVLMSKEITTCRVLVLTW